MADGVPRRLPSAPGPVRHPAPGRPPARHVPLEVDTGRGPPVRRGGTDVLPRHRRPRGAPAVLVQGRRAGVRADPRRRWSCASRATTATGCTCRSATCRRTRHPDAVHRLRARRTGSACRAARRSATTRPSSAATPAPSSPSTSPSTDVFPNCPRYIHRAGRPRAVGERARRRRRRPRSPSGSACRCSTRCSPPTTRPVPELSRRAFLALAATVVVGACSSDDDDAAPTTAPAGSPTTAAVTSGRSTIVAAADDVHGDHHHHGRRRPPPALAGDPFAARRHRRRPGRHVGRAVDATRRRRPARRGRRRRGRSSTDDFATVASIGTVTATVADGHSVHVVVDRRRPGRLPLPGRWVHEPRRARRASRRRPGRAEARRRLVPALRDRLLRRPPRPRRVGARRRRLPRRLHLRGRRREPVGGDRRAVARRRRADRRRRLPRPLRPVPRRRRPAGCPGGVPVVGDLGRPRGREQLRRARSRRMARTPAAFAARRAAAYQVWWEHMPVRIARAAGGRRHDHLPHRPLRRPRSTSCCSTGASSAATRRAATSRCRPSRRAPRRPTRRARCSARRRRRGSPRRSPRRRRRGPCSASRPCSPTSACRTARSSTTTSGTATRRPATGCWRRLRRSPSSSSCSPATSTSPAWACCPASAPSSSRRRCRLRGDMPAGAAADPRRVRPHRRRRAVPPRLRPPHRHAGHVDGRVPHRRRRHRTPTSAVSTWHTFTLPAGASTEVTQA